MIAKLKADNIRMMDGLKPEHEEAIGMVENEIEKNDLSRLERFKKWAKENAIGVSALAIGIAGLITTVVLRARSAIKQGAKATKIVVKTIENLAKKAGPLLGIILSMIATALSWGIRGLSWLASNLWVLAIAFAWFVYDQIKNRK